MSIPRLISLACSALLFAAGSAPAQLNQGNQWPTPKLTSVFPAGAKAGADVSVAVYGLDLDLPETLWFSHPGIKGTLIPDVEPMPEPKVDKKDMKKDAGGKKKVEKKKDVTHMSVHIPKDVPPGQYDVRIVTAKGISNPRVFVVGDLEEVLEKEPNNDVEQAQPIKTGVIVNGVISQPTDVDYFKFPAKKGERLLLHVAGASIDSRLFPEIGVFDMQQRRLGYARALPNEDVLLDFTAPAEGDYLVRLNQFTYTAGSSDYFYRLKIWPGPWIDAVFPPVVEPGKSATLTVHGRGLPGGQPDPLALQGGKILDKLTVTITAPADVNKLDVLGAIPPHQGLLSGFEYHLGASNPKFLAFAQAPIVKENDDNDTIEKAQLVTTPCEIVGRVDKKRDRDWFAFEAKKGRPVIIDAISQRLGAPTDLYFKLLDAKKKELALHDDTIEALNPRGYFSAHRDPAPYKFTPTEDGTYYLLVGSHSADILAGPSHVYRVRIAPEHHDFQLAVIAAEDYRADSFNLNRGGVNYLNVFAERHDNFRGDIALTMEGLPKGVTCPPQALSGKSVKLAVLAGDDAPEKFEGVVKVIGSAMVDGKKVTREARPASVTWGFTNPQNNNPTITRQDRSLVLAIRDKAPLSVAPTKAKVVVVAGEKVEIPYKLSRRDAEFTSSFQIQAATGELPTGITAANTTFNPGKDEQTVTLTTQTTTVPGTYNLVLRGFAPMPSLKIKNAIMPAAPVTLVVLPKEVAKFSLDNNTMGVAPGREAQLTLKLTRQFDLPYDLIVKLLPDNSKGVSAEELTIHPGETSARLTIKAADDAAPGARQNLTLRAVAVVDGVSINHDMKINVNVTKAK